MNRPADAEALAVRELAVHAGAQVLVQGVSFTLAAGESVCVLGESGSGKSLMAQALLATLPPGLQARGEVRLQGRVADDAARRAAWGRQLALLPQEPWSALDPTMRAGAQVAEVHRHLHRRTPAAAAQAAAAGLARLGLPAVAGTRFPHQLSGGMAQRVALAATLAGGAPLVVVDEPTKGLDTERRDDVVALLRQLLAAGGAVLAITHDVAVARALGGQVLVLRDAQVVEQGPAALVLGRPQHAYTQALLAAEPAAWPPRAAPAAPPGPLQLQARGLALARGGRTLFSGVDLDLHAGDRVALVGPSGAGKTSLGQVLLGLIPPDAGSVRAGPGVGPLGRQKLYQDPLAAFAPTVPLRRALDSFLRLHRLPVAALHTLREALGLADTLLDRLPHQVSGGELQRVALLRVLLLAPAVLFADEPTSRLDPLTQQHTLALLDRQLEARGGALVLVTHDPVLAARMADRTLRVGPA